MVPFGYRKFDYVRLLLAAVLPAGQGGSACRGREACLPRLRDRRGGVRALHRLHGYDLAVLHQWPQLVAVHHGPPDVLPLWGGIFPVLAGDVRVGLRPGYRRGGVGCVQDRT